MVLDSTTGKTITYNLDNPRLIPGAVPSQMLNCPKYMSAPAPPVRRSRDEKLKEKENTELADALCKSQEEHERQQKKINVKIFEM